MAVISINYAEDPTRKDLGYESVQILYGSRLKKKKLFASGDFVVDWFKSCVFFAEELIKRKEKWMESSSIDHFFEDGAYKLYDLAMLKHDDKKKWLEYDDLREGDVILFVKKKTRPTWPAYRILCGDPIKTAKATKTVKDSPIAKRNKPAKKKVAKRRKVKKIKSATRR